MASINRDNFRENMPFIWGFLSTLSCLVGVLVVIAILAITLFRPKIEELWNAIASGINGL